MNHCAYCNAPILSITEVCPNCQRKQPPYPPVLPGGGGSSYQGWALILVGLGVVFLVLGIATYFQAPFSTPQSLVYGDPSVYSTTGQGQYLGQSTDSPFFGLTNMPITPGFGYLIFFGGIGVVCLLWAFVSANRGRRIDSANRVLLNQMRSTNGNGR